ncbi:MAG: transcriptional regulator, partial [Desulfobacteraceae bacterium]
MKTIRQKIYILLQEDKQDARSLSQQLRISEKEILEHLSHVSQTARKRGQKLIITSSSCLSCGFIFKGRNR